MAWETRWCKSGPRRYYYSAQRRGNRVVKFYFGRGTAAALAAVVDARARRERADEAARLRRLRDDLRPADAALDALDDACDLAMEAALTAAGYVLHRRHWRPRYEPREGTR
jgi:hypothetical protein